MVSCNSNETVEALLECRKNDSLADPWPHSDKYSIFMHCLSALTIGLFSFATYCIRYKTINEAKFFSKLQFVHLIWTTFTDLLITSICTPIIFVPYFAGYFNGILSLLKVDPFAQTCLCLFSLINTATSILHMLWFKVYIVLPAGHWLRIEALFTKGLFLMYPLWAVFTCWCWLFLTAGMKEQWIGSLQRMLEIPSQLYDSHASTVFLVARREQSTSFKFVNVAMVVYVILCCIAGTWSLIIIDRLPTDSEKMKKLQRKAIIAVATQASVFIGFFSFPMIFFYFSGRITEQPLPVEFSYISFSILFLASIADSSTMIVLNEGYRNTFLEKTRLSESQRWAER